VTLQAVIDAQFGKYRSVDVYRLELLQADTENRLAGTEAAFAMTKHWERRLVSAPYVQHFRSSIQNLYGITEVL
jgi:hypothetical protein